MLQPVASIEGNTALYFNPPVPNKLVAGRSYRVLQRKLEKYLATVKKYLYIDLECVQGHKNQSGQLF